MKKAGILMPVASLPSPHYVGDFGNAAYRFADMIKQAGFSIWQVLPLNPLGYGNSPYQCYSSKALDECYVSLELLKRDHLIEKLPETTPTDTIDYALAKSFKRHYLREAFGNFVPDRKFRRFCQQKWVKDYAVFITFKEANDNKCWVDWPEEYKNYPETRDEELIVKHGKDIDFHMFVQYVLYSQFDRLKDYLKKLKIEIMGDMPFYVGIDSDDVYYNRDYFLLYDDGRPQWIAGVPPDYFSETGQRWGNPLYDWDLLREREYDFWFERIRYSENLYDMLRIDHFRAFDTYWKIAAEEETAINGEWIINSGDDFFARFFKKYPKCRIVAEDLGDLRAEVLELRDKYKLMGMRVLEFNFYEDSKEHEICYIGTHDNETMKKWHRELDQHERRHVNALIRKKYPDYSVLDGIIQYAIDMKSKYVILSVTDILLDDRRINLPGTIGSPNWEYKLESFRSLKRRLKTVSKMIKRGKRA
ncbi:MAG: 4-alpha-glucanotransferase [Erysipelotrichaceae bacterium]|nr:4-alpha-glucanotransferase [Erysipelotrichaceae bacterium]